jgi:guanylate kinase
MSSKPRQISSGKVVVLMGPSGSGKGTLLSFLRETYPDFLFAVSATTRAKRPGEQDGVNYHYLSLEQFKQAKQNGELLEWAQFAGNYYGTLRSEVTNALANNKVIVLEIEVQGVEQLQQQLPADMLRVIYVDAGDWDTLKERIQARAPISSDELIGRKERYEIESVGKDVAHYVVHNGNGEVEAAKTQLKSIIDTLMSK